MKPLVIYHANCTDGFTAAWCFHHKNPSGYEFLPASYGEEPPWDKIADRQVFVVDFSYPREPLIKMGTLAEGLTILDHHKTSAADLEGIDWTSADGLRWIVSVFDMARSGAGIAWDYLFPNMARPRFLGFVEDRDLWRFKFDETKSAHALMGSMPRTFEMWDKIMLGSAAEQINMLAQGAALVRMISKQVEDAARSTARPMIIGGVMVSVANVPGSFASDTGHLMGDGVPFAATYFDTEHRRCFSLRSRLDGMDVSDIAKQYGGGGHRHAAGFSVLRDHELAKA